MNSISEEDLCMQETLEFLSQELKEKKNFQTTNKYGGKGGFGLVLFVEDMSSKKKYAIKAQSIINNNTGKINNVLLKACQDEAQMMRECNHKNVVEIYSDFEIGLYHFIQMNLCECSLEDWINKNQQPINDMLFLHYVNQILDGLEYLHSKNFVLRDLSIRNILITTDGVIKLCDFGLAKKYDDTLKSKILYTQAAKGVFFYFPPELFQDMNNNKEQVKQTKQGDIRALGICLSLLGGTKIMDFLHVQNTDFIIPDSKYLSNQGNQLVKYILNRSPEQRPSIQQIREQLYSKFLKQFKQELISNTQQNTQAQIKISQNSLKSTNYSEISKDQQNTFQPSYQSIQQENLSQIKSSQQDKSIERLIDFDFNEIQNIYKKYQQFEKEFPDNIDVLITLGFIELKYNSNFKNLKNILKNLLNYKVMKLMHILEQKCLNIRKDYWRVYYIQSWLYYFKDKDQQCVESLQKGLNLNSNSILLLSLKILINCNLIDDSEEVKNTIKRIQESNVENDPQILFRIGFGFYNSNDYLKAIYYYKKALEYNLKDIKTLYDLKECLKKYGYNEEAQNYQTILLKLLSPQNSYHLNILGYTDQVGNKKLNFFQKAIEQDPQNIYAYLEIGNLFCKQTKYDEAIKQYEKIFLIDPDHKTANYKIGYTLGFCQDQKIKAIQYYKNSISPYSKDNSRLLDLARLYQQLKDYQNSIVYINQSLQINPKNSEAYGQLAQIEKEKNNIDKYFEFKLKQIELYPYEVGCLDELRLSYQELNNEKSKLYFDLQIKNCKKAIVSDNKNERTYQKLGDLYYIVRQYENAKENYKKVIEINSQQYGVYINLLYTCQELKENQQAIEYCEKYIQHKPKSCLGYYGISKIEEDNKNYEKCMKYIKKAIDLNPTQNSFYRNAGIYSTSLKQYKQACEYFLKAIDLNYQEERNLYTSLAQIEKEQFNNEKQAIEYYEKYLQGLTESDELYCFYVYIQIQGVDLARDFLLKALKNYPNNKNIIFELGQIEFNQDNYDKAIQQYKKATEIDQNFTAAYQNIGLSYVNLDDYDQALEYLNKAIQTDPNFQRSYLQIGQLYQQNKQDPQKAIIFLRKALELNNECVKSYFLLGKAFIDSKYPSEAIDCFQKVLELDKDFECAEYCKDYINKNKNEKKKKYKQTKIDNCACSIF